MLQTSLIFVARFHQCHWGLTHSNFNNCADSGGRNSSGSGSEAEMRSIQLIYCSRKPFTHFFWHQVFCTLSCGHFASCELRVASCELRVASCELRVASCELRVANCELRVVSC